MIITFDLIVKIIAFFVSLTAFLGIVWKLFKKIDETSGCHKEISCLKQEQQVFCYGILACLDGLKQLGANGNVTKAHSELSKYINKQAHK